MRKIIAGVLLIGSILLVAGFVWSRTGHYAPYTPLGPGDSYLALGDSLAAGFTVSDPSESYVGRLTTALQRTNPKLTVTNLAIPGETSGSLRAHQLRQAQDFIASEQAAGRRVSPITLDIGANDARAVQRGTRAQKQDALKHVETNLARTLDDLLAATRDRSGKRTADIAVMTYYNPFGGDATDQESPAYWALQLNQVITRVAAARSIPVADVATAFRGGLAFRYTYIIS